MPNGPDTTDANGMVIPGENAPFAPVSDWLNRYLTPMRAKITTLLGNIANLTPRVVALEARPRVARGYISTASDSNGDIGILHGLGAAPASVQITGGVGGVIPERRTYAIREVTTGQFVVRVYRQDTGAALVSNPVDFYWEAIL